MTLSVCRYKNRDKKTGACKDVAGYAHGMSVKEIENESKDKEIEDLKKYVRSSWWSFSSFQTKSPSPPALISASNALNKPETPANRP